MGLLKKILGAFGEDSAARFLKKEGYKIITKNYKSSGCEIDIIAEKDNFLVFIEVKTRSSHNNGLPEEAINKTKARNITKAALGFIQEKNITNKSIRCDIVSVTFDKNTGENSTRIIEDAIDMQGVIDQKRWVN